MNLFNLFFKTKKTNPFALPVSADYSYHAENLARIVSSYNVFTPAFLSFLTKSYAKNKPIQKFEPEALLPGVEYGYAFWVLNHCLRLVSARRSAIETLKNAKNAEAKYIEFKVFRPCPSCKKIPKDKRYKITDSIPIYPCEDCKEDNICIFTYNIRW